MDDGATRTLSIGLVAGFVIYAIGFAAQYVLPVDIGIWVFIALTLSAMIFSVSWFVAVRRGFRLNRFKETRTTKKLKARHQQERAKRIKLRR